MNEGWRCPGCDHWNPQGYTQHRGFYTSKFCSQCGIDRPQKAKECQPVKIVFCSEKGCGCHYTNFCPMHGEPEPAPVTPKMFPEFPEYLT